MNKLLVFVAIIVVITALFSTSRQGQQSDTNTSSATLTNAEPVNPLTNAGSETTSDTDANSDAAVTTDKATQPDAVPKDTPTTNEASNTTSTTTVTVTSEGFSPATVTIKVGDTVQWKNESDATVYVAPDTHPSHTKYAGTWDDDGTGRIGSGETYSFTFPKAGTYTYHDHLRSVRTGAVIVE